MQENFISHEHDYVNWSDEELGRVALNVIELLKSKWYSEARRKKQIGRLAAINFEQEQRYLVQNPEAFNLSEFNNTDVDGQGTLDFST